MHITENEDYYKGDHIKQIVFKFWKRINDMKLKNLYNINLKSIKMDL